MKWNIFTCYNYIALKFKPMLITNNLKKFFIYPSTLRFLDAIVNSIVSAHNPGIFLAFYVSMKMHINRCPPAGSARCLGFAVQYAMGTFSEWYSAVSDVTCFVFAGLWNATLTKLPAKLLLQLLSVIIASIPDVWSYLEQEHACHWWKSSLVWASEQVIFKVTILSL